MKVKFNLPVKRYRNKISFDSNTSFGCGNLQPLFSKFVVPKSKLKIDFGQLTRLAPLVVPSFARLKQLNDFVFVPIAQVMPSFDAFLSQSPIHGTTRSYTPTSLPCTTNQALFNELVGYFSVCYTHPSSGSGSTIKPTAYSLSDYRGQFSYDNLATVDIADITKVSYDFVKADNNTLYYFKLNQDGRFWFTVLLGLGYSCDPTDTKPVSILPLWAFVKAYYDVYYNKRYNAWHTSDLYNSINSHYNGGFISLTVGSKVYDMVKGHIIPMLFDSNHNFYCYAPLDNSPLNVATSTPSNVSLSQDIASTSHDVAFASKDEVASAVFSISTDDSVGAVGAVTLGIVNKLWDFVSRSSVVGQNVKDWFKVHFGVSPTEDMFQHAVLFASKPNMVNINVVVASADGQSGDSSSRLGDLAGTAFASDQGSVTFDVPTFGFVFCISGMIPLTRVSGGTQPELYNTSLFDMPFPDFDGLGYETINNSSLSVAGNGKQLGLLPVHVPSGGFGFLPRLSSYKFCNNFRSGGFAIPSIRDSYLSYCEDTVIDNMFNNQSPAPTPSNLKLNYPWRYDLSNFLSFNRIFYNQVSEDPDTKQLFVDDNFMSQSTFDVTISSYLKPLSDSYSIEELGKQLISSKVQ